jgi:hypothetical protein
MGAASSARMCEIPIRTGEAIVGLSRVECLQTALLLPVLYRDLSTSRFTSILPDLARPKKWPHSAAFLRRGFLLLRPTTIPRLNHSISSI